MKREEYGFAEKTDVCGVYRVDNGLVVDTIQKDSNGFWIVLEDVMLMDELRRVTERWSNRAAYVDLERAQAAYTREQDHKDKINELWRAERIAHPLPPRKPWYRRIFG